MSQRRQLTMKGRVLNFYTNIFMGLLTLWMAWVSYLNCTTIHSENTWIEGACVVSACIYMVLAVLYAIGTGFTACDTHRWHGPWDFVKPKDRHEVYR